MNDVTVDFDVAILAFTLWTAGGPLSSVLDDSAAGLRPVGAMCS
ncbi:hypothetical protein [Solilutibacter tolerans]|nr:hypothetical protein [Lysobacter tolerans]